MDRSSAVELLCDVAAVSRERGIGVKAAGLAYHAFNTLVPLVILLLVGVTLVDAVGVILEALETATGLDAAGATETLEDVTGNGGDRVRAALIAFVVLLWSAVRLFQAVNSAFTDVYGARREASLLGAAVDVSLTVATIAVGVTLVGAAVAAISVVVDGIWWRVAAPVSLFGLLAVAFFPTYYLFPQPDVSVAEVLPGTAFAAASWSVLALGFRVYVGTSESVALFGIAGAVLLILTWVYLGGLCILLGAVLNAVLADRVEADDGWIPMRDVWSGYA